MSSDESSINEDINKIEKEKEVCIKIAENHKLRADNSKGKEKVEDQISDKEQSYFDRHYEYYLEKLNSCNNDQERTNFLVNHHKELDAASTECSELFFEEADRINREKVDRILKVEIPPSKQHDKIFEYETLLIEPFSATRYKALLAAVKKVNEKDTSNKETPTQYVADLQASEPMDFSDPDG
jgi:superoxide dismutase